MLTIDTKSNERYYIILRDGKKYLIISKTANSLEDVKAYLEAQGEAVEVI